jgi:uncharacterized protein
MIESIRGVADEIWIHDTHEHLEEEPTRLAEAWDWTILVSHYADHDFLAAGMPRETYDRFQTPGDDPRAKWDLLAPYWPHVKHTGYCQAARISMRDLFGIEELSAETVETLEERMRALARPGFYQTVLKDKSRIRNSQVNALEAVVFRTQTDESLFTQDISAVDLMRAENLDTRREETGLPINTFLDYLEVLEATFERYGPRAVAIKNQCAYWRRLDFNDVPVTEAAAQFERRLRGEKLYSAEKKVVEDCVMNRCITLAARHGLPVKLHTGYYAGTGSMPLDRVGRNLADLCPVVQRHPEAKFVLMHIAYPYQDQIIAMAKHYANVYVDMCWAWIINPAASVRFVKEFLMAAPANKLLGFGGDYIPVEPVYGHARIARRGIAQALSELVTEGWLTEDEAVPLVHRILHDNAQALFPRLASLPPT